MPAMQARAGNARCDGESTSFLLAFAQPVLHLVTMNLSI